MELAKVNQTYYLQIMVTDGNGDGVPDLSILYYIYRSQGGALIRQGTMIGDVNSPGVYVQGYTFTQTGQYRIIYRLPENYPDSIVSVRVD